MRLVNAFAQQLGGTVQINAGNLGAEFVVNVPQTTGPK